MGSPLSSSAYSYAQESRHTHVSLVSDNTWEPRGNGSPLFLISIQLHTGHHTHVRHMFSDLWKVAVASQQQEHDGRQSDRQTDSQSDAATPLVCVGLPVSQLQTVDNGIQSVRQRRKNDRHVDVVAEGGCWPDTDHALELDGLAGLPTENCRW